MRKSAAIPLFIVLVLVLLLSSACGTLHHSTAAPLADPTAESLAAEASSSGPVVTLTDTPTTVTIVPALPDTGFIADAIHHLHVDAARMSQHAAAGNDPVGQRCADSWLALLDGMPTLHVEALSADLRAFNLLTAAEDARLARLHVIRSAPLRQAIGDNCAAFGLTPEKVFNAAKLGGLL